MQEERIHAMEVKLEPVLSLYEHEEAWHRLSVWDADCKRYEACSIRQMEGNINNNNFIVGTRIMRLEVSYYT